MSPGRRGSPARARRRPANEAGEQPRGQGSGPLKSFKSISRQSSPEAGDGFESVVTFLFKVADRPFPISQKRVYGGSMATVSVRRGDTMWGIARQRGLDLSRLKAANRRSTRGRSRSANACSFLAAATVSSPRARVAAAPASPPQRHPAQATPHGPGRKQPRRAPRSAFPTRTGEFRAAP